MVETTMDGLAWVRKQVDQADTDLLREMVKLFCERLMAEEAAAICGAPYGERSEERVNRRNGYRSRAWDTLTWIPRGCPRWTARFGGWRSTDRGTIFVGGRCQNVAGSNSAWVFRPIGARFDTATGALNPWAPPSTVHFSDNQFTLGLLATDTRLFAAIGGSDYVTAFALDNGDVGTQVWKKDTNGSAQDIALFNDYLIVVGHFRYMAPQSVQPKIDCSADPELCLRRVRIAAMDPATSIVDPNWALSVSGLWFGPWAVSAYGNQLYLGGDFTRVTRYDQEYSARLSVP